MIPISNIQSNQNQINITNYKKRILPFRLKALQNWNRTHFYIDYEEHNTSVPTAILVIIWTTEGEFPTVVNQ